MICIDILCFCLNCFQQFQGSNIKYTDGMKVGEKFALEYRKKRAEAAIPAVIEVMCPVWNTFLKEIYFYFVELMES